MTALGPLRALCAVNLYPCLKLMPSCGYTQFNTRVLWVEVGIRAVAVATAPEKTLDGLIFIFIFNP